MPLFHLLRTRTGAAVAAGLVALSLIVTGCSGSDSSSPAAGPSSSAPAGVAPMASTVTVERVAGTVQRPNRKTFLRHKKTLKRRVGKAVDAWIDGAFVGVRYPRHHFGKAFATFTRTARHDARRRKRLMTNWPLRRKIDGVRTRRRTVTLDVLAPHGRPAGVTARVALVFRTTGHVTKTVTVKGRLFLTFDSHGHWRVFGYDVTKGARR